MHFAFRALVATSTLTLLALAGCADDGAASGEDPVEAGVGDDDTGDDDTADDDTGDDDTGDDDTGDDDTGDDDTGDDDAPPDAGPPDPHAVPDASDEGYQCALLATQCHAFDRGTGDLGDQCHDIGHAGDAEECAEHFDECVAYCSADSGAGHHGDGDAGHSMCEEMGHLCHDLDTGPDAGLAHECHEVGHAGDEAACLGIYDECMVLCGGSNHEGDAGQRDEGDGGLHDDADASTDAGMSDAG